MQEEDRQEIGSEDHVYIKMPWPDVNDAERFDALKRSLVQVLKDDEHAILHQWSLRLRNMPHYVRSHLGLDQVDQKPIFASLLEAIPKARGYIELQHLIEGCHSDEQFCKLMRPWPTHPMHPLHQVAGGAHTEMCREAQLQDTES